MDKSLFYKSYFFRTKFSTFISLRKIILTQIILFILFFQGCAFFTPSQKHEKYFTQTDIKNIIQNLKQQEDIVTEFVVVGGKLSINGWIMDTSVNIDVFGKKSPLMLKMEISHSWGKPLFYFLIKDGKIEIRDFIDKKQYFGEFTPENFSRFIPNMDFSPDMIWSFLRGYPHFPYSGVYEKDPGVLILEGMDKKRYGTITFSAEKGINEAVSSPPRFPEMKFTDFRQTGEIDYAEKTVVEDIKGRKDLTLKRNKVIFNKDIPDVIFTLKNQPVFEVVNIDDM